MLEKNTLYHHLDLRAIGKIWTILGIVLGVPAGFGQFLARFEGYW